MDYGIQFTDVIGGTGCPLAPSPYDIYNDTVAYGWDTSYSFGYTQIDIEDNSTSFGGTTSISITVSQYNGLQFTRTGAYNPQYFLSLHFAAKSTSDNSVVRVYIGDGYGALSAQVPVTTAWQAYNVSVSSLVDPNESAAYNLVFQNFAADTAQFWFDEIRWTLDPINPLTNVTVIPPTGLVFNTSTTGAINIDTSTTTGTSGIFYVILLFITRSIIL